MRKVFSVALLACVFGLAQSAQAGVTIDVHFWDSSIPSGLTIDTRVAGDQVGPGCTFTGFYGATVPTGRCMSVLMKTTDPLIGGSARVGYDSDNGLAVMQFNEWKGVGVSFSKLGVTLKSCLPFDGVTDDGSEVGKFDCGIAPPNAPPSMAPGTYNIGTIVWDTSATTVGTEGINVLITGVGAVINGNIIDVTGIVVPGAHILNIIPEPGTASLLGLGLVGLIIAGRRSRA
jgi:hypothetical protein